jgi:hypothetical protein
MLFAQGVPGTTQDAEGGEAPTVEVVEPSRPLTELLEGWFGDGPWSRCSPAAST